MDEKNSAEDAGNESESGGCTRKSDGVCERIPEVAERIGELAEPNRGARLAGHRSASDSTGVIVVHEIRPRRADSANCRGGQDSFEGTDVAAEAIGDEQRE